MNGVLDVPRRVREDSFQGEVEVEVGWEKVFRACPPPFVLTGMQSYSKGTSSRYTD